LFLSTNIYQEIKAIGESSDFLVTFFPEAKDQIYVLGVPQATKTPVRGCCWLLSTSKGCEAPKDVVSGWRRTRALELRHAQEDAGVLCDVKLNR